MNQPASAVIDCQPWLSQGDIFENLLIGRVGISESVPKAALAHGPALLVSHSCAIDKKRKVSGTNRSRLEYLSFLPIHDVKALGEQRRNDLRKSAVELKPYEAMYIGEIPNVGEGYVSLVEPYTLPALLLRTELQTFTAEETGDVEDERVVASINDTRVGALAPDALSLFINKWSAQWTRLIQE